MTTAATVTVPEEPSPQFRDLSAQAMRFVQGGRDVYSFALTIRDLNGLLPRRVDDNVVSDAKSPIASTSRRRDPRLSVESTCVAIRRYHGCHRPSTD